MKSKVIHKALCGATRSRRGRFKEGKAVKDHEAQCSRCRALRNLSLEQRERSLELTRMIGDDLSDGAFWALANELGEW